jgi:prepilin-type N-terminal cleavage/methylation domain-containing protein
MTLNIFKTIQRFRKNRKGFSLIEISVVILIIGVLIAGISQASDMIDEAALKGARTASKGSRVGRVKDLVLWLDAVSDGGSLTAANKQAVDADPVTQLKDMNPRSSAKLTLAGTSTFSSNKVSGLPGLVFNGSSHFFKLADRFDNSTGEYTIYLVYQPVAIPASASHVIFEKRNTAQSGAFPYKLEIESTGFYKFSDSNGSLYGAKKASTGKVNLIKLTRSSAGKLEIFVDDVIKSGSDNSTSVVNSFELIIGAQNGSSLSNYANGRIGELIIFERDLAPAEKADIEAYLFKKWKIEKDATKASVCSTSTVANSTGTMLVGAPSFSCVAGYTYTVGGSNPSCLGAPDLTFTANGATCVQSSCFVNNAKYTPSIVTVANAGSVTCKNGGTNPSGCTCSGSPSWTFACTNAGSCT